MRDNHFARVGNILINTLSQEIIIKIVYQIIFHKTIIINNFRAFFIKMCLKINVNLGGHSLGSRLIYNVREI